MKKPQTLEKGPAATARGAKTRARIVEAASRLVAEHGVGGTRLDDIMAESGTSKSQIYHYFSDREALMCAVVEARAWGVLQFQESCLSKVRSFEDLRAWRDMIIEINRSKHCVGGCPIGSLASELADRSETARDALARSFVQWDSHLVGALERMRHEGSLSPAADIPELATGILTALQGGLLMAQTMRTTRPLAIALDMALEHVNQRRLCGPAQEAKLGSKGPRRRRVGG
ncbi:MAG: TetR/AcrR family transcriptional regulator [Proteobacteria bacterium]|nr:TetR/AcrR family transcriptional regulator [Pseudomonadota bacterium]